ncbi:uncharacterized protein LOC135126083 isoform X1 [Zophobas morio]|uniref:uncharacterized protein LOC135126083 isoform X1 n=1 Tax=Zophobas morio TaxID=2755281 RepID=UPI0030833123
MNCDITDDENTTIYFMKHPWRLQTSIQSNFNHPILDERWEAMNVIKTEYVELSSDKLLYQHFQNIVLKKESFDIPLSIRIEKEGHIFLCDGEYPPNSRCYWFMLQAFSGMGSAIRKCEKGYIPSEDGKLPQAPCNEQRVYKNHNIVPTYLSNKMWSHFVMSKHKNVLRFSQFSHQKEKLIMEWEDYDIPIDVTHIIVHSKRNNGLWKIHNLDFLYADAASSDVNLGPPISSADTFVCISMYVTMCPSCKLVLSLEDGQHVLKTEEFELKHAGWDQIKIMTENANTSNAIKLLVTTKSSDPKPYWAIDKVRFCQKKEFRMLRLLSKWVSCQLISDSEQVTDIEGQAQPNLKSKCSEDTIGEFCVPCHWMSYFHKIFKVCKERKCVCSAGYYGSECRNSCPSKTYGHGCQKQCTKCYGYCNSVTGTCSDRCLENYYGEKCDIPPAMFANSPEITEISYTEATVRVSNFQLKNSVFYHIAQYYTVQYKTADALDINWRKVSDQYHEFNTTGIFKILNLTSGTQYLVRSVIIGPNGVWNMYDHLKVNNFTTRCNEIAEDDINIETSKTTARIYLSEGTTLTCKSHFITLDEKGADFSNRSGTFFTNLLPYKSYMVRVRGIQKTYEKKFTTDEEAPTVVLSLTGTAASATTIVLKWAEPLSINGVFKHYVVEYQHVFYRGCHFSSVESSTISRRETENTSVTITELIPYSTYEFTVFALNTKFTGPPVSQRTTTPYCQTIQPEETPNIVGINTTHESASIILSEIKCENIRGPLTVEIKTTCISEWCQNKNTQRKIDNKTLPKTGIIEVMNLQSFSEYDLQVQLCRVNGSCSAPQKKKFETKTTVSKSVSNLLVYTKKCIVHFVKVETALSTYWCFKELQN